MKTISDHQEGESLRAALPTARRVVVKIGTRVLVRRDGRPDDRRLRALVGNLSALHAAGRDVAVVSSGAVGAGMETLGLRSRPKTVADLQMAAAVGQSRLMARYDRLFGERGLHVGQVLLTHDGLRHRERHLNARHTLLNLLRHRIVPIINENDTVSVEEIRFGDNDLLAALVSVLIEADLLVLLTTVDGLRAPASKNGRTRRIAWLPSVTPEALRLAVGKGSEFSVGGMASKLESAQIAAGVGIPVVIADGRRADVLSSILEGADRGTLIGRTGSSGSSALSRRRRWIAFFHKCSGTLIVDDGASRALVEQGKSLLPIGIRAVEGRFGPGSVVQIKDANGRLLARGQTGYGSEAILRILGRKTSEIAGILGSKDYDEIVHRDNLAILMEPQGVPS
ncbi:MAG: glutamate 5-kinase [Kiritimatiellia bacterium]|nr:glutamate 5-kinase [Kiritimatiellia bacterium]